MNNKEMMIKTDEGPGILKTVPSRLFIVKVGWKMRKFELSVEPRQLFSVCVLSISPFQWNMIYGNPGLLFFGGIYVRVS